MGHVVFHRYRCFFPFYSPFVQSIRVEYVKMNYNSCPNSVERAGVFPALLVSPVG